MKVVLCLLVLVAAAYAAPRELTDAQKRVFLDDLGISHLFDLTSLTSTVCEIVALGGSDDTEAQCETLCNQVLTGELLHSGCPLICHSFQSLVHLIHFCPTSASL